MLRLPPDEAEIAVATSTKRPRPETESQELTLPELGPHLTVPTVASASAELVEDNKVDLILQKLEKIEKDIKELKLKSRSDRVK